MVTFVRVLRLPGHARVRLVILGPFLELGLLLYAANEVLQLLLVVEKDRGGGTNIPGLGCLDGGRAINVGVVRPTVGLSGPVP